MYISPATQDGRFFDAGLQAKAEAHAVAVARGAVVGVAVVADIAEVDATARVRRTQPPAVGGSAIPVLDTTACVFEIRILLSFVRYCVFRFSENLFFAE